MGRGDHKGSRSTGRPLRHRWVGEDHNTDTPHFRDPSPNVDLARDHGSTIAQSVQQADRAWVKAWRIRLPSARRPLPPQRNIIGTDRESLSRVSSRPTRSTGAMSFALVTSFAQPQIPQSRGLRIPSLALGIENLFCFAVGSFEFFFVHTSLLQNSLLFFDAKSAAVENVQGQGGFPPHLLSHETV